MNQLLSQILFTTYPELHKNKIRAQFWMSDRGFTIWYCDEKIETYPMDMFYCAFFRYECLVQWGSLFAAKASIREYLCNHHRKIFDMNEPNYADGVNENF